MLRTTKRKELCERFERKFMKAFITHDPPYPQVFHEPRYERRRGRNVCSVISGCFQEHGQQAYSRPHIVCENEGIGYNGMGQVLVRGALLFTSRLSASW